MATIKKKYQSGGPAEAMQKAMGQKPTSTKETLKYVRKNGSGYIPPVKSDTTSKQKPAVSPFDRDYLEKQGWKKKSSDTLKKPATVPVDFDKINYKNGGVVKPKAQLGKIVKFVGKALEAGNTVKKVANAGKTVKKAAKPVLDFRKAATKSDVSDAFKLAERARLKKMLQDIDKGKGKMQTGGTTTAPKKPIVNKTVAPKKTTTLKNKMIDSPVPMKGPSRPAFKPMFAKKGGMVKKNNC